MNHTPPAFATLTETFFFPNSKFRSPAILNRCLAIHATSTQATNWFLTSTGLAKFLNVSSHINFILDRIYTYKFNITAIRHRFSTLLERGCLPLSHFIRYFSVLFLPIRFPIFYIQGLSLVLTVLFRFLAGALIWVLLFALVLGALGGTGYLWYIITDNVFNRRHWFHAAYLLSRPFFFCNRWAWNGSRGTSGENSMLAYAISMSVVSVS